MAVSTTRALSTEVTEHRLEATTYDRWFDSPWGQYAFNIEAGVVLEEMGRLSGSVSVLDAGCATGRFTARLEASGASVVGLDIDPAMLDLAATRTHGLLIVGNAAGIPVPDGSFDRVVAMTLCEFANDPAGVFAELARVTRPGGRIVVGALNPRSPWGLRWRHRLHRDPWHGVRFLSRQRLLALARPFGRISIRGALYAPGPFPGLQTLGPMFERLGRLVPGFGAFQVVTIQRSEP
jgi:SAM-dependent methyltransferase